MVPVDPGVAPDPDPDPDPELELEQEFIGQKLRSGQGRHPHYSKST